MFQVQSRRALDKRLQKQGDSHLHQLQEESTYRESGKTEGAGNTVMLGPGKTKAADSSVWKLRAAM